MDPTSDRLSPIVARDLDLDLVAGTITKLKVSPDTLGLRTIPRVLPDHATPSRLARSGRGSSRGGGTRTTTRRSRRARGLPTYHWCSDVTQPSLLLVTTCSISSFIRSLLPADSSRRFFYFEPAGSCQEEERNKRKGRTFRSSRKVPGPQRDDDEGWRARSGTRSPPTRASRRPGAASST